MSNLQTQAQPKTWQLVLFAGVQTAAQAFLLVMNFSSYIATGLYGVAVVLMSLLLTGTRMWDAITDPIIGFILDHVNTKWGRYRPMMVIGYAIMVISTLFMFFFGKGGILTFATTYIIYIIGYTILTAAYKAAIPIMTNDPKKRPLIGRFQAFYMVTLSTLFSLYLSNYLAKKHRGINPGALQELLITTIVFSGIIIIMGIIAIKERDTQANISRLTANAQPKLKDCFSAVKGNRPLQMIIITASTDKLAQQIASNSSINIMLFGILLGNYAFNGSMSLYAYLPSLIFITYITRYARKLGSKRALTLFSWAGIFVCTASIILMTVVDPSTISVAAIPTLLFVLLTICRLGIVQANASLTNITIADCADYEMYRSGKFMPGLVSTVFSFVDKMVSSLSNTIVGLVVAAIGYTEVLPAVGDPLTSEIFLVTLFLAYGVPILGWVCSVIALKFYNLTSEKMAEIQKYNTELRTKKTAPDGKGVMAVS